MRADPLSPGVGQSDFARLRRQTTLLLTQGGVLLSLVPLVWEFSVDTALLEIEAEPPAEFAVVSWSAKEGMCVRTQASAICHSVY